MPSRSSPAFKQSAAERARTWRMLVAVALSAFVHALLMSVAGTGLSGKRAEQEAHTQLRAMLVPASSVSGDDAAEAALAEPFRTFRSDVELTARERRTESRPASRHADRRSSRAQQTPREHVSLSPPSEAGSASDPAVHAPDPTYYSIRQLDIYPMPMTPLSLSRLAPTAGGRARALVELQISEVGMVDSAKVLEAQPPGRLDSELTALFLAARFTPAVRDGRAVRSRVVVHIE